MSECIITRQNNFNILDVYPIGSIYLTINNISPTNLFGGNWELITDRFLLGAGNSYVAGSTGGEATHTLTINEMPRHRHSDHYLIFSDNNAAVTQTNTASGVCNTSGNTVLEYQGNNQPHNNIPPYLAVYIWKRVS